MFGVGRSGSRVEGFGFRVEASGLRVLSKDRSALKKLLGAAPYVHET